MDEIKQVPSYAELRDKAVQEYYKERKSARRFLLLGVLFLLLSLYFFVSIGRHPYILIVAVCIVLSVWWIWDSIKKFPEAKRNYIFRLKRAVEIMTNANVFMQIPQEDLHRFDKWWQ